MPVDSTAQSESDDLGFSIVLIERGLAKRLEAAAAAQGDTVSELVTDICELWLDQAAGPIGQTQLAVLLAALPRAGVAP